MKKIIINIVVLVFVAAASFFLGAVTLGSKFVPVDASAELQDELSQDGDIDDQPVVKQKGAAALFFFPDINSEKGMQNTLAEKSEEVLGVWEILRTSNGVINVIQAAHSGSSDFISPLDKTMNKMSDSLLWAYGAVEFLKYLLLISSRIILVLIIPVFLIISIVSILKSKDKKKRIRLVVKTLLIGLVIMFAIPVSLQVSMFVQKTILSDNIENLITSIEEKGEAAQRMENEITTQRRQGRSVLGHMGNAKEHGILLIEDITGYLIIFIFIQVVIPVLVIFGLICLTMYIKKHVLKT